MHTKKFTSLYDTYPIRNKAEEELMIRNGLMKENQEKFPNVKESSYNPLFRKLDFGIYGEKSHAAETIKTIFMNVQKKAEYMRNEMYPFKYANTPKHLLPHGTLPQIYKQLRIDGKLDDFNQFLIDYLHKCPKFMVDRVVHALKQIPCSQSINKRRYNYRGGRRHGHELSKECFKNEN